jgi:hypothetical protein
MQLDFQTLFMSTTLTDQLKVKRIVLEKPLPLQLAVQGSRSKINLGTQVEFQYQGIMEQCYFDIINISSYDLILGCPWIYQHKVMIGLNPTTVVISSNVSLPIERSSVMKIASRAMDIYEDAIEKVRQELMAYAEPICIEALDMDLPLPPLRVINHTIPLIDKNKIYPWRLSRCPEALKSQWAAKRDAYIWTGCWAVTTSASTAPMHMITKPGTKPPLLRNVRDLRARNLNTLKMASPLPDIDGIVRRVARHAYHSLMDGKEFFEQIQVIRHKLP